MTLAQVPGSTTDDRFDEVLALIQTAKRKAMQSVNTQLIALYWQVGAHLCLAVQEKWSKRELERQFKAALFERSVTQPAKVSAILKQTHPSALEIFRDAYMVEFLDLPGAHAESQGGTVTLGGRED